jgi:hypothetical protein
MAYYETLDSYIKAAEEATTVKIVAYIADGAPVQSSVIPAENDIVEHIRADIEAAYDGNPFTIWNRESGELTHVHIRDVRAIKLVFSR